MLTRIHVNQHVIRANAKTGADDPPLTIKRRGKTTTARSVVINGPCAVVYRPNKPLSCGARVWVETRADVTVD